MITLKGFAGNLSRGEYFGLSFITQATYFFGYLGLMFFPIGRFLYIDIQVPVATSFTNTYFWSGAILFIFLSISVGYVFLFSRSQVMRWIAFCFLWPLVMFVPEFSTVRISETFVLYRSYLWMIGLYGILAVPFLFVRQGKILKLYTVILVLMGLFYAFQLHKILDTFISPLTVFEDAVQKLESFGNAVPPQNYRLYNNYAHALLKENDWKGATRNFSKAVHLYPEYVRGLSNLGVLLLKQKHYDDARIYLDRALAINPKYVDAINARGSLEVELNNHKEGREYYLKSLQIVPRNAITLINLANVSTTLGMYNEALKIYHENEGHLKKSFTDFYFFWGRCAYLKRDWKLLDNVLQKGIRNNPQNRKIRLLLSLAEQCQEKNNCDDLH